MNSSSKDTMVVAKRTRNSTDNCPNPKSICGLFSLEDCIQGAKLWNRMTFEEKESYRQMDSSMEVCEEYEPIGDSCGFQEAEASCSKRSNAICSLPRKRKKPSGVKRKKWVKPGPVTTNPYLNYIRTVRRKYCGLLPKELVSLAAYNWRCLTDNQKLRYRLQACNEKAKKRLFRRIAAITDS